ncbi:hypothetical protein [Colwellia sp. BRX10-4]|uniref:hypothetical protein n=1 Tax=Colwellia sp. BRX10-4 TaxID=2759843 RepID=UPI0015F4C87D|nr:hypothetical protein [Colwellia sp. BRX10-4]MBA6399461.1 hypothetical protein [Colwellia sp. BRX10-4]
MDLITMPFFIEIKAKCDICKYIDDKYTGISTFDVTSLIEKNGWIKKGKKLICPDCSLKQSKKELT